MRINFIELMPIQKAVNKKVFKRLAEKDKDFPEPIDYVLAMHVEFFELVNELGVWKWWKFNHKVNIDKVLEELADVIAFFLSAQISFGNKSLNMNNTVVEIQEALGEYSAKDIIQNISLSVHEGEPLPTLALMGTALHLVEKVCKVSAEQVIEAYEKKSEENINRQNNDY